jgi:hypothetical protein
MEHLHIPLPEVAQANRAVKQPPFWIINPRSRFTSEEGAFWLRIIANKESKFYNCLHALPEATVSLFADLVEADPLPANPHTELRSRLAAHQLTNIQWVEQLSASRPSLLRSCCSYWRRCCAYASGARRKTPSSTACSSTSCPGSFASPSPRQTWRQAGVGRQRGPIHRPQQQAGS